MTEHLAKARQALEAAAALDVPLDQEHAPVTYRRLLDLAMIQATVATAEAMTALAETMTRFADAAERTANTMARLETTVADLRVEMRMARNLRRHS